MESRRLIRQGSRKGERKKGQKSIFLAYLNAVALALVLAVFLRTFVAFAVMVEGPSMQPNLYTADMVLAEKVSLYLSPPRRFDIVIVAFPDRQDRFIKRVVGLPGESVMVQGGVVYINRTQLDDPYNTAKDMADVAEIIVPEDHIYVMGDNRNNSRDSRDASVGPIPLSKVYGKGLFRLWPLNKLQYLK